MAYVLAWVGLLGVPANLGFDRLLVRNVAAYHAKSEWGLMHGMLKRSNQLVFFVSTVIAILAGMSAWIFLKSSNTYLFTVFILSLILLPVSSLNTMRTAAMQGLRRVVVSQLPSGVLQPILLISILTGWFFLIEKEIKAPSAVGIYIFTGLITLGVGIVIMFYALPGVVRETKPQYQTKLWLKSGLPLLFASSMQILISRTDIIMLGTMKSTEEVGIYSIANRVAYLVVFGLMAVNTVMAPNISRLYASRDMGLLQKVVKKAARVTFGFSFLLWFLILVGSNFILTLYGPKFIEGRSAAVILCTGLFLCTAAASVGLLLSMTGHEKDLAVLTSVAAITNIFLNFLLIPKYSIEGAAVASTISVMLSNLLAFIYVRNRLGINASIFGKV